MEGLDSWVTLPWTFKYPRVPDPRRDLKLDPLEPCGKLYKDYIGIIMGLYRGSNF